MSQFGDYIFVLWGNGFDETTATIFITELRRVGLPVKLVGLSQRRSAGVMWILYWRSMPPSRWKR